MATDRTRASIGPAPFAEDWRSPSLRRKLFEDHLTKVLKVARLRAGQALINRARRLRQSRIVMYHAFTSGGWGAISPGMFRHHLEWLGAAYEVVSLPTLAADLVAGRPTEAKVALTVDDGYEDFFTEAYPILLELRIPATVFIPTAFVGHHNAWERPGAGPRLTVMSAAQLRELDPQLITVGSHSVNHRVLTGMSTSAWELELQQSKMELEDILGRAVTLFAYPFGYLSTYTTEMQHALRDAGYVAAVSTRWGIHNSARDRYALRRISFRESDDRQQVQAKLAGDWDWICARELLSYTLSGRWAARAPRRVIPVATTSQPARSRSETSL